MSWTLSNISRIAGLCLALALTSLPAVAEEPTESHIAAARAAIAATHTSEQFDTILIDLSDQAKALFTRANPGVVQDINEVVDQVALELAKRRPELDRELERVWAARLTEDELKEVTAFFTSPTGVKFGKLQPEIFRDSVESAKIWREAISTEIVAKSRDELLKRGHKF